MCVCLWFEVLKKMSLTYWYMNFTLRPGAIPSVIGQTPEKGEVGVIDEL